MNQWIPACRIRLALALGAALALMGLAAGWLWSPWALLLLIPSAGAAWAGVLMLMIRRQLSGPRGFERRIHALVVSRLAPPPGAAVLDIGCGDASLLVALLGQAPGVKASGVDYWGKAWDYARAACEARLAALGLAADFRRMDAAALDFPQASFDAVVSVMCFHEVRPPAGSNERGPILAVREALRVLRPGGAFVLVDRFADVGDYGDGAALAAALAGAEEVKLEPIVPLLAVPWPLSGKRALGPVEVLSGVKRGA